MCKRALGHNFFIIENKFMLHFGNEVYKKFYSKIDFESFEIIESNGSSFHYFRDKNNVYLDSYMNSFAILANADPTDFTILDFKNGWSSSNGNDYLFDEKLPHPFRDYVALSNYYQRIDNTIYFRYTKKIVEADAASFEILHKDTVGVVAKDKKHVYFRDKIVEEADAETFQFLEECFMGEYYLECDHTYYAKDKKYAYYINTIVSSFKIIKTKNLNQFQFKIIDNLGYAFDEKYRYLGGKREAIK